MACRFYSIIMLTIAFINCKDRQFANNSKEMKTVDYVDLNNVTITFVNPASGDAYFN